MFTGLRKSARITVKAVDRSNVGHILVDVPRGVIRGDFLRDVIMIIMLLALVSCTPTPVPNMENTATASAFLSAMTPTPQSTSTQECVPPCFYGITPGKTTSAQSIALLQTYSSRLVSFALHLEDGEIWWSFMPLTRVNKIYFDSHKIVETIVIYEQVGSTVGDIVKKYGPPNLVILGSPGGGVPIEEMYFVYPSSGIAFGVENDASSFLDQPTARYIPEPDMLTNVQVYFAPDTRDVISNLHAWNGFVTDKRGVSAWRGFGVSYYQPR